MKDGCLFIENPEAHLHPQAQARFMELVINSIVNNKLQVFIETHSEHILNASRLRVVKQKDISKDDIIIYFFDNDYKVSKLIMDDNAQIENWPNGFFDQLEKDLAEILRLGLLK